MMKDPRIVKTWKRDGFTMAHRTPKEFPIKIGRIEYIPYQFAYDKTLKDYVWKFKRGDTLA